MPSGTQRGECGESEERETNSQQKHIYNRNSKFMHTHRHIRHIGQSIEHGRVSPRKKEKKMTGQCNASKRFSFLLHKQREKERDVRELCKAGKEKYQSMM